MSKAISILCRDIGALPTRALWNRAAVPAVDPDGTPEDVTDVLQAVHGHLVQEKLPQHGQARFGSSGEKFRHRHRPLGISE